MSRAPNESKKDSDIIINSEYDGRWCVVKVMKKIRPTALPPNVVGPLVRKFRRQAGLSQKELAGRCEERGVKLTRGTLAKIESQVRFIKACELFIIAKVLKIPIQRFYPPGFGDQLTTAPVIRT